MPRSKRYLFHPQAWQELEAADDWYRQRSSEASVRFLSAINVAAIAHHKRKPGYWKQRL